MAGNGLRLPPRQEIDGNNLSMGLMKGLQCGVCFPDRLHMGTASLTARVPLLESGSTGNTWSKGGYTLCAWADERIATDDPPLLVCGPCASFLGIDLRRH